MFLVLDKSNVLGMVFLIELTAHPLSIFLTD